MFWWYTWKGKGLLCFEFWERITEMFIGTISVREDWFGSLFYFYWNNIVRNYFIHDCKSLILTESTFFYLRSSLTSLVRFTVSLFSLTLIVFLIVSSIFLSLLVLTTWSIRWSLLSTNVYNFYSLLYPFKISPKLKIFLAFSAKTILELHSWKHYIIFA